MGWPDRTVTVYGCYPNVRREKRTLTVTGKSMEKSEYWEMKIFVHLKQEKIIYYMYF